MKASKSECRQAPFPFLAKKARRIKVGERRRPQTALRQRRMKACTSRRMKLVEDRQRQAVADAHPQVIAGRRRQPPPPYPPLASKGKQTHKPDATSGSPSKPLPSVQRRRRCQMGRTGPVLRKICVVEGRIEFGRQPTGEGGCRQAKAGDGTKRRQKDGRRQTPPLR